MREYTHFILNACCRETVPTFWTLLRASVVNIVSVCSCVEPERAKVLGMCCSVFLPMMEGTMPINMMPININVFPMGMLLIEASNSVLCIGHGHKMTILLSYDLTFLYVLHTLDSWSGNFKENTSLPRSSTPCK